MLNPVERMKEAYDRVLTNSGAQAGDVLVLTKALGTGIIATALKKGESSTDEADDFGQVSLALMLMATLGMLRQHPVGRRVVGRTW